MTVDRKTLTILLAALDIERRELAELMAYEPKYVVNVLNGFTAASPSFRLAFGAAVAELILGPQESRRRTMYPAAPLAELIRHRAEQAACKSEFYSDLGISPHGWKKRAVVGEDVVDSVCCKLGVHPSNIYGDLYQEAS